MKRVKSYLEWDQGCEALLGNWGPISFQDHSPFRRRVVTHILPEPCQWVAMIKCPARRNASSFPNQMCTSLMDRGFLVFRQSIAPLQLWQMLTGLAPKLPKRQELERRPKSASSY